MERQARMGDRRRLWRRAARRTCGVCRRAFFVAVREAGRVEYGAGGGGRRPLYHGLAVPCRSRRLAERGTTSDHRRQRSCGLGGDADCSLEGRYCAGSRQNRRSAGCRCVLESEGDRSRKRSAAGDRWERRGYRAGYRRRESAHASVRCELAEGRLQLPIRLAPTPKFISI